MLEEKHIGHPKKKMGIGPIVSWLVLEPPNSRPNICKGLGSIVTMARVITVVVIIVIIIIIVIRKTILIINDNNNNNDNSSK